MKKINKIGMMVVATVMFLGAMFLSMEKKENGKWGFVPMSAFAQSESGGGGDCIYVEIIYEERFGIVQLQCCITEYQHYTDMYSCYIGPNCPCDGRVQTTKLTYVGANCCG